jgi:hypothetical protein
MRERAGDGRDYAGLQGIQGGRCGGQLAEA